MRGMDHKESAQKTIDAFRIHYNFIREHGSIKKTPAEQAGIKLELGQNKIENLIRLASKNQQIPYIQHCSMTNDRGEGELFSKQTDASKVKDIARKFFQYNYSACSIESATLQNNTWSVKALVTLFGQHSDKTLVIDSKTGRIIN